MKIVIISGSRNQKGQTAKAVDALIQGVEKEGMKTELIFLPQMKIERCRQCEDHGWGICRLEGKCVIKDDFVSIVDKIKSSDAAVFATPVYYGDLSETLRAFLDRLRRICTHEKGREKISGKMAVGICVAGGGGGGAPSCTVSM
jgi:multimeric flavodoxin WrbA